MKNLFDSPAYDPRSRETVLRQNRQDMLAMLDSEAGQRFLVNLLVSLGLGQRLSADAGEIALYNQALEYIELAREASPTLCQNLLAGVFQTSIGAKKISGDR